MNNQYNILIDLVGAFLVGLIFLGERRQKWRGDPMNIKLLNYLMLCCSLVFLCDIPGLLLDGKVFPMVRALLWIVDSAYWVLQVVYCWLWMLFADYWANGSAERLKKCAPFYAIPMLAEIILIAVNPLTGWIFILDDVNVYSRGSFYLLNMLPYCLYIVGALILTIYGYYRTVDTEKKRNKLTLAIYMFLPICGVVFDAFVYGISWVWPMVALSLLMVYLNAQEQVFTEDRLAAAKLKAELTEKELAAAKLEAELTEKELTAAKLEAELAEKELAAAKLEAELTEKELTAAKLEAELAEKELAAVKLKAELSEKELAAAKLEAELTEKELAAAKLEAELTEKELAAAKLEAELTEKELAAVKLKAELSEKELAAAKLEAELAEKELAAAKLESELTEGRVAIMLSQIQPHFLYNSLNTMDALCDVDTKAAQMAIRSFAKYLRGNMDAISRKTPVPFRDELSHLREYLTLETFRFDKIQVEYDLEVMDFMLPALSLQPIVENAVKHGVLERESGGTITITTRDKHDYILLTVMDDGIGYDTTHVLDGRRSHIGISNVRSRLKSMCGGTLTVESTPNVGTIVTFIIPWGEVDT